MQRVRSVLSVTLLIAILFWQSFAQMAIDEHSEPTTIPGAKGVEWVKFELRDDVFNDAVGSYDDAVITESRNLTANTILGTFNQSGLIISRPIGFEFLQPRSDLKLALISPHVNLLDARAQIAELAGLEIREYIAPSGLIIQGTANSFDNLAELSSIAVLHSVPVAFILEPILLDALLIEHAESSLVGEVIRLEGWRDEHGLQQSVLLDDGITSIQQDVAEVVNLSLSDPIQWDVGRYEGRLTGPDIINIALQPSIKTIRFNPSFTVNNNNAVNHMQSDDMKVYFTTDLDGSGQTVAVADSGLDHDHGDFGNRILANNDVINDGSTADQWSGHGTHVSCTILGDGTRGNYQGVVPDAMLYFQAMENDDTGNLQSPSLNSLLNSAYNGGARTHTNSWGNDGSYGQYNVDSQDVDDRANYYDKYYDDKEGLTILFAAGNYGPGSNSIAPPATAKNAITVGMHQNRYQGSPDYIMDDSSRGPVDDGRIKPDVLAPGGYVRSCRAQEAVDTDGASWYSNDNWYIEYSGTSMATPNAAGAAIMLREYLEEIALRDSPQGALIKALLILGAEDVDERDIPNNDEGWGRVNVRNSLAPPAGQGIWVDDRAYLSATGNSKSYNFNVDSAGDEFKVVLSWSDEYASTWSQTQLVNNLDLQVTDPNGVLYLGNDFLNGQSTTGGDADSINNVEVVLIDSAIAGSWTVKVVDVSHGGSSAQPFALAVMGHGLNDLKPDLMLPQNGYYIDIETPSVGQEVQLICAVKNAGNVRSEQFEVDFEVDGVVSDTQSLYLEGDSSQQLVWYWTPQFSGQNTLSFIIDKSNVIEESFEINNRLEVDVLVSNPGVIITSETPALQLLEPEQASTTWTINIQNTGLLPTNVSITKSPVILIEENYELNWFVELQETDYWLDGLQSVDVAVTMVHSKSPPPGSYQLDLLVQDLDNGISESYDVQLIVGQVPNIDLQTTFNILPVHPIETSNVTMQLYNTGNTDIAYDLQVQPPNGWEVNFNQDSVRSRFASSTAIQVDDFYPFELVLEPPETVQDAGTQALIVLSVTSQTDNPKNWIIEVPIEVESIKAVNIRTTSPTTNLPPGSNPVLVFTVENLGNIDVELFPTIDLPTGVEMLNNPGNLKVAVGSTELYLVTLGISNNSQSGQAVIHFDNGSERFTWQQLMEIQVYPKPSLEFQKVIYPDGQAYTSTFYGTGSHPAGAELEFIWNLTNNGDIVWQPIVQTISDNSLSVNCKTPSVIGFQESTNLSCVVAIDQQIEPYTEPEFTIKLSGSGAYQLETYSLYIEGYKQLSWTDLTSDKFNQDEPNQVQISVTNTGTLPFNHLMTVQSSEDWLVDVIGDGIVHLQVGESKIIKFTITPKSAKSSEILFEFSALDSTVNVHHSFAANAVKQESEPSFVTDETFKISLIVIVLLVLFAVLFKLLKPSNGGFFQAKSPNSHEHIYQPATITTLSPVEGNKSPVLSVAGNYNLGIEQLRNSTTEINPLPIPVCWNCRTNIIGKMLGCPNCGARYHYNNSATCDVSKLEHCLNCQTPSEKFQTD